MSISSALSDSAIRLSEKIEQKIGTERYRTWLSSASYIPSENENEIIVAAPNTFISGFIEKNFASVIRDSIYELTHKNMELRFVIASRAEDSKIVEKISSDMQAMEKKKPAENAPKLVPSFTFENFVIGSNNEFAYTSALAVAEAPGRTNFNPLFIYGKTGLGKTHLLQAIGHFALAEETAVRVLYITSHQFLTEYMNFIHGDKKKSQEFTSRYKNIDILLIDDIHFLAGKKETQNQFYLIFEALASEKKQIVITSDRPPSEIKDMAQNLLNRFSGGLLVDIQPPGYETKMAILQKKAEQNGLDLPPDVLEIIAGCPTQNVRELDGLLIKVIAYSNFTGHDITPELLRQVLGEAVSTMQAPVTMDTILTEVAREFGISKNKLCALSRCREVAVPRQICMYLCKGYTKNSLATIGVTFNRNHSTVIHSLRRCDEILQTDSDVSRKIRLIEKKLGKRSE
ncbi:MAG: chromosomal replication initiator protein DnaA [Fibrobacterota bacterium]